MGPREPRGTEKREKRFRPVGGESEGGELEGSGCGGPPYTSGTERGGGHSPTAPGEPLDRLGQRAASAAEQRQPLVLAGQRRLRRQPQPLPQQRRVDAAEVEADLQIAMLRV